MNAAGMFSFFSQQAIYTHEWMKIVEIIIIILFCEEENNDKINLHLVMHVTRHCYYYHFWFYM